jgi:hypothetical protein
MEPLFFEGDSSVYQQLIPIRNQRADKIHSHPVIDLTTEELFS